MPPVKRTALVAAGALSMWVTACVSKSGASIVDGWLPPGSPDGRLEPDAIQAVVRADFDRMRECYEIALSKKPNLHGRVTSKFLINRNGAVARVADGGSDLPDHGVVQCVLREFGSLKFPHPEGGGGVVVVYPIMFNPAD
jgi:hypothetical protein